MSAAYPVVWRSVFILAIKWVGELLFYALTLLFVVLVALIFYGGGQAEIERQVNAAIGQENQTTCGRLGMALGTPHYGDCAAALKDVRDQEHQREIADDIP
jgi:membrane protein required for beta-lactamase induction